MGMIYDPSDARKLVEALGSNVTQSQHIMENLQSASNKLLTSIGPGTSMTGAAVEAGRGLFSQLVLPTIKKASEAIEKVSSEKDKLNELIGPAGGEILDEDKLNEQLQEKHQQQSNVNSMINMYRMQGSLHSDDSKLSNMYSDFQKQWTGFLGTVEQDIEDINKKLQKLHTFNTGANALFTDSLNDLKNAMKILTILNNTSVDSKTGTYKLPKGLSIEDVKNGLTIGTYSSSANVALKELGASKIKISKGTWHNSPVKSTKSGLKTWKQVNGDVNRFKSVKGAKSFDEILNGTGKFADGIKGVGTIGGIGAAVDGLSTYEERKNTYGQVSAAIDGTIHTTTAVGSIYAGAAIGSLIPIPVVGTVAGAVGGYLVNGVANTIYDGIAHGKWNWDNFKLW